MFDEPLKNVHVLRLYGLSDGIGGDDVLWFGKINLYGLAGFVTANPLHHVQVTDVSKVTANELTISGTVFSSVANIASVKAALFDLRVDLETDTAAVATFVGTNGADLSITADQYAVGSFTDFAMNSYFSNIVNVDGNLF